MLIHELAYDTEADELDLLIDTFQPESAETIDLGNDIFVRRSVRSKKIVGAVIANYSLWQPDRFPPLNVSSDLAKVREGIVQYLLTMKHKDIENRFVVKPPELAQSRGLET